MRSRCIVNAESRVSVTSELGRNERGSCISGHPEPSSAFAVLLANSNESVPDEIDRAGGRTDEVIERSGVWISGPARAKETVGGPRAGPRETRDKRWTLQRVTFGIHFGPNSKRRVRRVILA